MTSDPCSLKCMFYVQFIRKFKRNHQLFRYSFFRTREKNPSNSFDSFETSFQISGALIFLSSFNKKTEVASTENQSLKKVLCKKGALRKFAKFTGKYLCRNLFLIKLQACQISKNIFFTEHLRTSASKNLNPLNMKDFTT